MLTCLGSGSFLWYIFTLVYFVPVPAEMEAQSSAFTALHNSKAGSVMKERHGRSEQREHLHARLRRLVRLSK